MKKFFSLVLALVMALSLTTVAWGATPIQVGTFGELAYALDNASDGDVIELTADIEVTYADSLKLTASGNITIDGKGFSLYTSSQVGNILLLGDGTDKLSTTNYVIKDIVFESCEVVQFVVAASGVKATIDCDFVDCTAQSLVYVKDADVTIENSLFEANTCNTSGSYGLVTIHSDTGSCAVNNCEFSNNTVNAIAVVFAAYSAFDAVGNTFTDNTVTSSGNGAVIYADEVTATGNTFTGNTVAAAGARGGAVVADEGEVSGNVFSGNAASSTAAAPTYVATVVAKGGAGTTFDVSGNYWDGAAPDFVDAKPVDGETHITATTYYTTATGGVLGGAMTVGGAYSYDMVTTDAAQTKTVGVTVTKYTAKAPKDTNKDGLLDQDGNVEYMVFSSMPGKYFVQVNTVGEADYTVYQTGTKTLLGYFNEVASPFYKGNGVAFYDFGEKCGQYNDTPVVGANYYLFQGVLCKAVKAGTTEDFNLMVGNVLTPVDALADAFVDHVPAFTYDKTYKVTAVKCAECGTPAVLYANYASVPKADKGVAEALPGGQYYVWLAGPVADTETKVESAETFDAGIAMYVGMSVMAAAGSAVVIGKKKD